MAAGPGATRANVVLGHYDDVGDYDVRRHGTPPPRHLQAEDEGGVEQPAVQAVPTGMATSSGGSIPINHMNQVASQLRDEMSAVRTALEADFNAMKRDLEIKMSGRKGTGHYESGAIETL